MKVQLKVVLFGCLGMVIFSVLSIAIIFGLFFSSVDKMEKYSAAQQKEYNRLQSLNTLKGVIVNENESIAPFSNDTVALCLLRVGEEIIYSGGRRHRNRHRHKGPKYRFHLQYIVVPGSNAMVKIGTAAYRLETDHLYVVSSEDSMPYGDIGATFITGRYTVSLDDMIATLAADEESQSAKKARYVKDRKSLDKLYGIDKVIDQYIDGERNRSYHTDIILSEVLFRKGDSIAIKATIENGHIIPLY